MRFAIIDPTAQSIRYFNAADLHEAEREAGLDPTAVDHGTISRDQGQGIGIVVYEFGLLEQPDRHRFFAIEHQLFAGPAILYGFDSYGETRSITKLPNITWFDNLQQIEVAIEKGQVARPIVAVNNEITWSWPSKSSWPPKS